MSSATPTTELAGKKGKEATHSAGRGEPFHDWFPYLEGFSPGFVETLVGKYMPSASLVLEPFAGVGTTPITLAQNGISCAYCEVNPVLQHLIATKSIALKGRSKKKLIESRDRLNDVIGNIAAIEPDRSLRDSYARCFGDSKYFDDEAFLDVLRLKTIERSADPLLRNYLSIAAYSSLLAASLLKRAGDVRFKTAKELAKGTPNIVSLFQNKLDMILNQCVELTSPGPETKQTLVCADAKNLVSGKVSPLADGVITSPPYLNGTNYFRNTRLELWYREEITRQSDLRDFRDRAITAGINDVSKATGSSVLSEVEPYHQEISSVAYDKRIPKMISAYFNDMKQVLAGIKQSVKKDAAICIDIGDSVYSGVHIPTHTILVDVAKSIGLRQQDEIVLRDRFSNNGTKLTQTLLVFKNE